MAVLDLTDVQSEPPSDTVLAAFGMKYPPSHQSMFARTSNQMNASSTSGMKRPPAFCVEGESVDAIATDGIEGLDDLVQRLTQELQLNENQHAALIRHIGIGWKGDALLARYQGKRISEICADLEGRVSKRTVRTFFSDLHTKIDPRIAPATQGPKCRKKTQDT